MIQNTHNKLMKTLDPVLQIIESNLPLQEKLQAVCQHLHDGVGHYHWVGFYVVGASSDHLVLGPYVGAPTDHTHIPFGKGVCGQVAVSQETRVIQDVSQEDNYLSCSVDVQSEIVVPVMKQGRFVAELDIDSHELSPFSEEDRKVLETICEHLAEVF